MIAQEAWGGSHDADILSDILSEGGASGSQLDEGDELGSYNSDYGYDDSASMSMSGEDRGPDTDDDDESMRGSPAVNANRLPQAPLSPPERRMEAMSIERLNVQIHQQLRVQGEDGRHDQEMRKRMTSRESPRLVSDEEEEEEDDDREGSEGAESDGEDARSIDSEGTDGGLPELSVTFADPEGSHFEELLYWLYTGNSNRWIQFFTPENYGSILQNILHLNIVTNAVLDICLVFEASTSPELGLRGMARAILCAPSLSSPSSPLSSIDVSAEVAAGMEPTDTAQK
ncbi:hypothetical protein BGX33_003225 [Mortierella sp. NVP41]|nr:hypothetical protein BGX33_003225 [Mortierella sp. NVP41]